MTKPTKTATGIIKFKSKNFKYSFRISNYSAAQILGYIAQIDHKSSKLRDNPRDEKGHFLPKEQP